MDLHDRLAVPSDRIAYCHFFDSLTEHETKSSNVNGARVSVGSYGTGKPLAVASHLPQLKGFPCHPGGALSSPGYPLMSSYAGNQNCYVTRRSSRLVLVFRGAAGQNLGPREDHLS